MLLRPDISFAVLPIRRHAFFEQTVLQGQIGDHLLERRGLTPKTVDLVRGGGPGCIASQALLASLQEVFRPAIVQVLRDPLAATQLGNAVLAAQAWSCPAKDSWPSRRAGRPNPRTLCSATG